METPTLEQKFQQYCNQIISQYSQGIATELQQLKLERAGKARQRYQLGVQQAHKNYEIAKQQLSMLPPRLQEIKLKFAEQQLKNDLKFAHNLLIYAMQ
jgi:uncharacterized protein YukE